MGSGQHMIRNARIEDYSLLLPKIEQIQFYCGRWHRNAVLEPAAVKNLKRMMIASSAASSTRIEGARLNDAQALDVLSQSKILYEERSAREVLGYAKALDHIFKLKQARGKILDREFIFIIHRMIMKYEPVGLTGLFRLGEVNVTDGRGGALLFCALPDLIPGFMKTCIKDLCSVWKSGKTSRLLAIVGFVAEFLAIHPFEDGNGRCARLLTVHLLRQAGHDYVEYTSLERQIEKKKVRYYLILNEAQKTGKMDGWSHFFLDTILAAQNDLEKRLRTVSVSSSRGQSPLLKEVLDIFRTQGTLRAGEIVRLTQKSPAGVRKALSVLVKNRLVKSYGKNRGRYYCLTKP